MSFNGSWFYGAIRQAKTDGTLAVNAWGIERFPKLSKDDLFNKDLTISFDGEPFLFAYGGGDVFAPTPNVLWLPAFLLLAFVASLGVGLWLSAMNVQYRDVRYVVPFITQFWMLATPVAYPSSLLSPQWRVVYAMNPMVGVIEGFRWALLGTETAPGPMVAVSSLASVLILISGAFYFRRMEKTFADVV